MTHTPASTVDRTIVRRHRNDIAPERADATAGRARGDGSTAAVAFAT